MHSMPFLPEPIWRRRLDSEYGEMRASGVDFSSNADRTEYVVQFRHPGLCRDGASVRPQDVHKVRFVLGRLYPYAGGLDVVWLTPIFHPNIRSEDGKVCIQLLNNWAESQTLVALVKGLKSLLDNPNPKDPLNKEAADFFSSGSAAPRAPRVVSSR
jgi:ubiquitin-protein ligase